MYALLVVALAGLYFLQQRMVAARAAVSPTMSPAQQKLMQYLPVVFAIFQVFFLAGLIIYYMAQAVLRIGQQAYITRRFYGHEDALGRQAQRAGHEARELAKNDPAVDNGDGKKGGFFAQMRTGGRQHGRRGQAGQGAEPRRAPPAPRHLGQRRGRSGPRRRRDARRRRANRHRGPAEDPAGTAGRAACKEQRQAPTLSRASCGADDAGADPASTNGVNDGVGGDDSADGGGGQGARPRSARRSR